VPDRARATSTSSTSRGDRPAHDERGEGGARWPGCHEGGRLTADGRKYTNYRDLSVQQLGSIYERLLEHEVILDGVEIIIRPNVFARKGSAANTRPTILYGLSSAKLSIRS
jgi:hypothetical protein